MYRLIRNIYITLALFLLLLMIIPVLIIIGIFILLLYLGKIVYDATLTIATDKNLYARGEDTDITGHLETTGGVPLVGKAVSIVVNPPVGDAYVLPIAITDASGNFQVSPAWVVPSGAELGVYTLSAASEGQTANATFTPI